MRYLGKGIILTLLLVAGLALSQAETDDTIVLRLGDSSLTVAEFEPRYRFYLTNLAAQRGIPLTPDVLPTLAELRPIYLDQLATELVVLRLGQTLGLTASEAFVDEQIAEIRSQFDSDETFSTGLDEAGIEGEAFLRLLVREAEITRQTVARLSEGVTIRDYQVALFYQLNSSQFATPGEVCVRHILVGSFNEASQIREQLVAGASFEDTAATLSTDSGSAARGGDLGCIPMGATVPEFDEVASTAPLNEISEPVETDFGFHLILPYDRTEASTVALEQVDSAIREELESDILRRVIEGYRARADLELFEDAVMQPSEGASE